MTILHSSARIPLIFGILALISLLVTALLLSGAINQRGECMVYVGTYTVKGSQGIYAFPFDTATGTIGEVSLAAATESPSFLATDHEGQFLYAVNEIDNFNGHASGAISAFSIDPKSGALKFLQQVSSLGSGPAHLSLDQSGRYLLVANYGGGNMAVFPIEPGGQLGTYTAFMQSHGSSVNRGRQEAPHAHCILATPDNRLILVADLGIDKLLVYNFDEGTGTLKVDSAKSQSLAPGAGPRHVAIVPSGKHWYVVNELSSSVTHFAYDALRATLETKETLSSLPPGFTGANSTAEIITDAQGRSLYVSNRGDDSIVLFRINTEDGSLKLVDRVPCGGKSPRNIALDPSGRWLFSANQNSNQIMLFQVDSIDGRLTATSISVKVVSPVCITFVAGRQQTP